MKVQLMTLVGVTTLGLTGCMDYRIIEPGDDETVEVDGSGAGSNDDNSSFGDNSGDDDIDRGDDEVDEPDDTTNGGSSDGSVRAPAVGDLVIHEVMIDPVAVSDAEGEWVEIYNRGGSPVDLLDHRLADDNKDDSVITETYSGSLIVEPGEFVLICALDDYFDNGGVDCHGVIHYETWGGGFALSNTGDEIILLTPNGGVLDAVEYGENFSVAGAAMGLDNDWVTHTGNDKESHWCEQDSRMSFGDEGTPGRSNNYCF